MQTEERVLVALTVRVYAPSSVTDDVSDVIVYDKALPESLLEALVLVARQIIEQLAPGHGLRVEVIDD